MKLFAKEVVSSIKNIGAIAPSSKYLAKDIIKHIDFKENQVILEFGCGNGAITRQVLKQIPASSRLISLEINEPFLKHCQNSFSIYKNFARNRKKPRMELSARACVRALSPCCDRVTR